MIFSFADAPRYFSKKFFAASRSFTYIATCSILINATPHYLIRYTQIDKLLYAAAIGMLYKLF